MSKTPQEYFAAMPAAFQPDRAAKLRATYQFELSGEGGGTWFVRIHEGTLEIGQGAVDGPDVTIRAAAKDYVAIAEGRMNPMLAMATGKFKIKGNMGHAMKLQTVFKR